MKFLNVKLNALRRNKDKTYTLNCSTDPHALCHACMSFKNCKLRSTDKISTCKKFTPILIFSNFLNLDKPNVNTLRIGQSWFNRLSKNQIVGCYDRASQQLWFAKVTATLWHEDKDLICRKHGEFNHLGMELIKSDITMKSILERCYGKGFYRNSKGISVIYLELIRPMNVAAY